MLKLITASCLFLLPLKACTQSHQGATAYKKVNNKQPAILRSDGLYNTYDASLMPCGERINYHYKIYEPLYILNGENATYLNGGGDRGTSLSSLSYFQNLKSFQNIVGVFSTEGNKIKATLPIELYVWGMRLKTFTAPILLYMV